MSIDKSFEVMDTRDAREAAKRDMQFLHGGATIDKESGQIVLTDKQLEKVREEEPCGLPKGVVDIAYLEPVDLKRIIGEEKIAIGTKQQLADAFKEAHWETYAKHVLESREGDCWAFTVTESDERKWGDGRQVRVVFLDGTEKVATFDLVTSEEATRMNFSQAILSAGLHIQPHPWEKTVSGTSFNGIINGEERYGFKSALQKLTRQITG